MSLPLLLLLLLKLFLLTTSTISISSQHQIYQPGGQGGSESSWSGEGGSENSVSWNGNRDFYYYRPTTTTTTAATTTNTTTTIAGCCCCCCWLLLGGGGAPPPPAPPLAQYPSSYEANLRRFRWQHAQNARNARTEQKIIVCCLLLAAAAGSRNVPKARRIEGSMEYMVSRAHSCHQPCALSTRPYRTTDSGQWSTCCLGRTVVMSIRNVNIAV